VIGKAVGDMGNGLMSKKKKKNNNKYKKKRPNVSRNCDWSKLCPDVLRKIFETLKSPIDSHRAFARISIQFGNMREQASMSMAIHTPR